MTIEDNYSSINSTINQLRNLLITKLNECYVTATDSMTLKELIDKVGDIRAVEVDNKNNNKPTSEPAIDDTDISIFNITLYKRIRYYMRLLGFYLVLKGVSVHKVNEQTDLKGLIELIDDIDVITSSILTIIPPDRIQYYGENIVIPYILVDINGQEITEGDITITDSKGIVYESIEAGKTLTISPLAVGTETFTITYHGYGTHAPSAPQTFTVDILQSRIRFLVDFTNISDQSRYYNDKHTGYENDIWRVEVQTLNYQNQPLADIPFNISIPGVWESLVDKCTDENGKFVSNEVINQAGDYAINCATTYEETDKLTNTTYTYDMHIKYGVLKPQGGQNTFTDYLGKDTYKYYINTIDEDSGEETIAYNGKTVNIHINADVVSENGLTKEEYTTTAIIRGNKCEIDLKTICNPVNVEKIKITWTLQTDDFKTSTHTTVDILSNFILPDNKIFFLDDTPVITYAPLGTPAPNTTIQGQITYTDDAEHTIFIQKEETYYDYEDLDDKGEPKFKTRTIEIEDVEIIGDVTENITFTTDADGNIYLNEYKTPAKYTLTLYSNYEKDNVEETLIYDYTLEQPFDIKKTSYTKTSHIEYRITIYDIEHPCIIKLLHDGVEVDSSLYSVTDNPSAISVEDPEDTEETTEEITSYLVKSVLIPISNELIGENTLSVAVGRYREEVKFLFVDKIFDILTPTTNLGHTVIEIKCYDNTVESITLDSPYIDVIDIEKDDNNIFYIECDLKKTGLIDFTVTDDSLSSENLSITVEKENLLPYVDVAFVTRGATDDRTEDYTFSYVDVPNIPILFNIKESLYPEIGSTSTTLPISYTIEKKNNPNHIIDYSENFTYPSYNEDEEEISTQLSLPTLPPGTYYVKFNYAGNSNYTPFVKTIEINILKSIPTHTIAQKYTGYANDERNLQHSQNSNFQEITVSNKNIKVIKHTQTNAIFKKGNYTNTYIVIQVTNLPTNVTLNLLDENLNQLYSPYNTNGQKAQTPCKITAGQVNVIQLPAHYVNGSYTDFAPGTYNWNLKFDGNDYWEAKVIPFTVEIRDFKTWEVITPRIYPNDDVQVKVRSYVDTIIPANVLGTGYKSGCPNSSYNESTGIITYHNSDIDTTLGAHTKTINQASNYIVNYEVMNPIVFYTTHQGTYKPSNSSISNFTIGAKIAPNCTMTGTANDTTFSITINNKQYTHEGYNNTTTKGRYYKYINFPPDTYDCVVNFKLDDNKTYTCSGSFTVSTKNCEIYLDYMVNDDNTYTLIPNYTYNMTPIPNAKIGIIDVQTNTLKTILTTDNNGECTYTVAAGVYKAVAINSKNQYILESNIVDFINVYRIVTDVYFTTDNNKNLYIDDISSLVLNRYKINTALSWNSNDNLVLTSISLLELRDDTEVIVNVVDGDKLQVQKSLLSEIDDNDEILDYISIGNNDSLKIVKKSVSDMMNIVVVTDVKMNNNYNLDITREKYVDVLDIDNIVSDVSIVDGNLLVKTIGDIKEELYS